MPAGMPTLRKELNDSVFYLYGRDPKTGKIVGPHGTGFLIARAGNTEWSTAHYYAISNWHVAVQGGASIIRFNTKDGGFRHLECDPSDWLFMPDSDDIAAVDITADIREADQIFVQPEESFLTPDIIQEYEIGFGEDVFIVGMFAGHHGGDRNIPAARFGNLSMLANSDAPIKLENGSYRPSHLVDMRSRGGFSGSPVFIYRVPATDLSRRGQHKLRDELKQQVQFIASDTLRYVGDNLAFGDRAVKTDDDKATLQSTVKAAVETRQRVRAEAMKRPGLEGDCRPVKVAPLQRITRHGCFERLAGNRARGKLVSNICRLAGQIDDAPLIAERCWGSMRQSRPARDMRADARLCSCRCSLSRREKRRLLDEAAALPSRALPRLTSRRSAAASHMRRHRRGMHPKRDGADMSRPAAPCPRER